MAKKVNYEINIRSSAAEYLTFIAATGDSLKSIEVRYGRGCLQYNTKLKFKL